MSRSSLSPHPRPSPTTCGRAAKNTPPLPSDLAFDWRRDLEASRDIDRRDRRGYDFFPGWFERWRIHRCLGPELPKGRQFWREQVLGHKPHRQAGAEFEADDSDNDNHNACASAAGPHQQPERKAWPPGHHGLRVEDPVRRAAVSRQTANR